VNYSAIPRTRLSDGTSDVDFEVGTVDLEILKLPFTVPDDQARRRAEPPRDAFAETARVVKVHAEGQRPPLQRQLCRGWTQSGLYAPPLFRSSFQKTPTRGRGDSWDYKSELLGGAGDHPPIHRDGSPRLLSIRGLQPSRGFEAAVRNGGGPEDGTPTRSRPRKGRRHPPRGSLARSTARASTFSIRLKGPRYATVTSPSAPTSRIASSASRLSEGRAEGAVKHRGRRR